MLLDWLANDKNPTKHNSTITCVIINCGQSHTKKVETIRMWM